MSKTNEEDRNELIPEETKVALKSFQNEFDVFSKGKLSLVIQLTRMVKGKSISIASIGLPNK